MVQITMTNYLLITGTYSGCAIKRKCYVKYYKVYLISHMSDENKFTACIFSM